VNPRSGDFRMLKLAFHMRMSGRIWLLFVGFSGVDSPWVKILFKIRMNGRIIRTFGVRRVSAAAHCLLSLLTQRYK
jgi:hypothetical protein